MIIRILMVALYLTVSAHQYHGFDDEYRDRSENLLIGRHPHASNLKHAFQNRRRLRPIPKLYSPSFKTKHSNQDLPTAADIREHPQSEQKKKNWNFNPRNLRQSPNKHNYHLLGKNNIRNTIPRPVGVNGYKRFSAIRPNTPMLKRGFNYPITSSRIKEAALNKIAKPYRRSFIANPLIKLHPNLKIKRYNEVRPKRTEEIINKNLPRERKSIFKQFNVADTVYMVELFFIFVPLMSFCAVILLAVDYCWKRGSRKSLASLSSSKDNLEPTIGSAFLQEQTVKDVQSESDKPEDDIVRNFVTNEIDADGDNVGRHLKLQRWMGLRSSEDKEKVRNKLSIPGKHDVQSQNDKVTVSESNIPLVPNPRMSPTKLSIEVPFPNTNKQADSINNSRYPATVNPIDGPNNLRTFDSHAEFTKQVKDNENRRRSKSKKRKDKGAKDSESKYSSEPFGSYGKIRKNRKH